MLVSHLGKPKQEKIRLAEAQLLEVMNNCERCHTAEYADWSSGGHSMDYRHVFLNAKHNATEQINFDCLRCHGMFFKGTVDEVVTPLSTKGPWKLKDEKRGSMPAIPLHGLPPGTPGWGAAPTAGLRRAQIDLLPEGG
jgi:hypothetical protein